MRGNHGEFVPLYFYPTAVLDRPPTVADGWLSADDEARNRAYACLLMAKAGRMLTLPQGTISTSQVLLHRFYFRCSMYVHKLLVVTMTCLFLGTKLEETPLKLRYIFSVFDRLLKRQAGLDTTPLSEQRFQAWSDGVKDCEGVVLQALGFELYVDMPHKFILHFINYLHPTALEQEATPDNPQALAAAKQERQTWSSLNQRCWSTLNDCLLSSRVLFQYEPEVIACAAIYLSANTLLLTLPPEWWRLFDVETHTLQACAVDITRLYTLLASSSTSAGALQYTPTDPDDNARTNELIVYAPRNRAQLLEERKQKLEAQHQARNAQASPPVVPMEM